MLERRESIPFNLGCSRMATVFADNVPIIVYVVRPQQIVAEAIKEHEAAEGAKLSEENQSAFNSAPGEAC